MSKASGYIKQVIVQFVLQQCLNTEFLFRNKMRLGYMSNMHPSSDTTLQDMKRLK